VSVRERLNPKACDALKLVPYSTYRSSPRWYQFIDGIWWRSGPVPVAIDAEQTGVTEGNAATHSPVC
jgi:hypothetical protein